MRAVASGRQKGGAAALAPGELRYVDLKAGRRLQVVTYDETQAFTANHAPGVPARDAVDALLDEPFGNWHVDTTTETHQLRVTKKLEAVVHTAPRDATSPDAADRSHDRTKPRLLPEDHPVLRALGISDETGRVKPSRQAKYRQVEEFLRLLDQSVSAAIDERQAPRPHPRRPAARGRPRLRQRLPDLRRAGVPERVRGIPVHLTGVDTKAQSLAHGEAVAAQLGVGATFVQGGIADAVVDPAPEVVLALHACDTATDDALARAVGWDARLVLAAPCCHHDIAAQLRRAPTPAPYASLTRDGILRERLADTLTDALRASLLRLHGYRVDVVEFVGSEHTPRNTLLRALRTRADPKPQAQAEYDDLTATWRVTPRLAELLA